VFKKLSIPQRYVTISKEFIEILFTAHIYSRRKRCCFSACTHICWSFAQALFGDIGLQSQGNHAHSCILGVAFHSLPSYRDINKSGQRSHPARASPRTLCHTE